MTSRSVTTTVLASIVNPSGSLTTKLMGEWVTNARLTRGSCSGLLYPTKLNEALNGSFPARSHVGGDLRREQLEDITPCVSLYASIISPSGRLEVGPTYMAT